MSFKINWLGVMDKMNLCLSPFFFLDRSKLVESESLNAVLRRKNVHESPSRAPSRSMMSPTHIPLTSSSADYK